MTISQSQSRFQVTSRYVFLLQTTAKVIDFHEILERFSGTQVVGKAHSTQGLTPFDPSSWARELKTGIRGSRPSHRIFGVFGPTTLIQRTLIFGLKLFTVHKNIFLSNFFVFDQRDPIFTLAVVAVSPKRPFYCANRRRS